jgi:hypothetical protein
MGKRRTSGKRRETRLCVWLAGPRALLGALLAIALAACSEPAQETAAKAPPPRPQAAIYQTPHLTALDRVPPEVWLASRQAGRDLPADDQNVAAMRRMLDTAGKRFRDFPRMVANRAVQLEVMLEEKHISEPAPQLIAQFSDVAGEARNVESFGAFCQQYFNLRMQGLDQRTALQVLRDNSHAGN